MKLFKGKGDENNHSGRNNRSIKRLLCRNMHLMKMSITGVVQITEILPPSILYAMDVNICQ